MVKVKRGYVLGSAVCTVVAVALSITSIATENWIQADLRTYETSISTISHVRYGLFAGVFTQVLDDSEQTAFEISMTCLYDENSCAMLCRNTADERQEELKDLVDGKQVEFNCSFIVPKAYGNRVIRTKIDARASANRVFINAGCYLSTLIFLVLSIVIGGASAGLLIWNVAGNPVQTMFSIYSLYYYVGTAAGCVLLAIIIWGALFAATIMENVAIVNTLNGLMHYEGNPILDYSYWLNIGSLVLYFASFGLLMTRKYLMDTENLIMRNINQGNQVIF